MGSTDQQVLPKCWPLHLKGTCTTALFKPGVSVPPVAHELCDLRNASSLYVPHFVHL